MKRIFAMILVFCYFSSANLCFAAGNLYVLQNTNKSFVQSVVEQSYSSKNFKLSRKDPYMGRQVSNPEKYSITILQNSGNDVLCYFNSNSADKVGKDVLKQMKKMGYTYTQSENTTYLANFDKKADEVLNNISQKTYDFNQPQTVQNTVKKNVGSENSTVLKGYVGQVAKGTSFIAYLQTPINTATAQQSDSVTAVLSEDWTYQGNIIAPQGSVVNGTITKARAATYGSRNGRVVVAFDNVVTPDGKNYKISTEPFDVTVTNDGKFNSTVQSAAIGVALGALAGLLIGLCSSDGSVGKSTLWGAGVGTGLALAGSAVEQGVDAEIPVYTEIEMTLNKPLSVILNY